MSVPTVSQSLRLESLWKKDSPVVYIGIRNELVFKGNTKSITGIESPGAAIIRRGDTLFVSPKTPGELSVHVKTAVGDKIFVFQSKYLPDFDIILTNDFETNRTRVKKEKIFETNTVRIFSFQNSKDNLFSEYEIIHATVSIGVDTFLLPGNSLSSELQAAIEKLSNGSELVINQVIIANRSTKKTLTIRCNRHYQIL